jgi:hypothetical protein
MNARVCHWILLAALSGFQAALPIALIICGRGGKFDAFRPSDQTGGGR